MRIKIPKLRVSFIFVLSTFMVLALSCGVVWARLTITASVSNASLPLARPTCTFWIGTSTNSSTATTQVTTSTVTLTKGQYLFPKVNTYGINYVVRGRADGANISLNWTGQSNNWRYYAAIVNKTTDSFLSWVAALSATASVDSVTFKPYIEFMQADGVNGYNGFVSKWSSLSNNLLISSYNTTSSPDERTNIYGTMTKFDGSTVDKTGPYMGVYATSGGNRYQLGWLNNEPSHLDTTTSLYAALTASGSNTFTATGFKYNTADIAWLFFYNNTTERMIFIVSINFLLYDSNCDVISNASISSFSYTLYSSQTFVAVSGASNTYAGIAASGGYPNALFNSSPNLALSITTENAVAAAYAKPVISIQYVDVDTFQLTVDSGNSAFYSTVYDSLKTGGKLISSNTANANASAYVYWLKQLSNNTAPLTYYNYYASAFNLDSS